MFISIFWHIKILWIEKCMSWFMSSYTYINKIQTQETTISCHDVRCCQPPPSLWVQLTILKMLGPKGSLHRMTLSKDKIGRMDMIKLMFPPSQTLPTQFTYLQPSSPHPWLPMLRKRPLQLGNCSKHRPLHSWANRTTSAKSKQEKQQVLEFHIFANQIYLSRSFRMSIPTSFFS